MVMWLNVRTNPFLLLFLHSRVQFQWGKSRYYLEKWFSNAPDPQIGSYVEVWTDGSPENQPYSGQA
ncbi:hypothetical protein [Paenibacillus sp. M2]|uniref:hypothetical protein n=1 Tax=Paenibacillus sp. M2 TaxID=3341793 RepID=UPI003989AD99